MKSIDTDPFDLLFRLTLVMLLLSVGACGSTPSAIYQLSKRELAKNRPAYKQFQELCASPDRSRIYKTANVDGYLFVSTSGARCKGGWDALAKRRYKHYECSSIKVKDRSSIKLDGDIYRLELGEAGDARCVAWDVVEAGLSHHDKVEEFQAAIEGKCFIQSEVSNPQSLYGKLYEFGFVDSEGNHILRFPIDRKKRNLIHFSGVYVFNLETKEILSIDRDYEYWPEGVEKKAVGKYSCDEDKNVRELEILVPKS